MASRTNKQGIAAKKAQQAKQAKRLKGLKRFEYPKRNLDLQEAKDLGIVGVKTNPKGRDYHWFLKGRRVCRETRIKCDPDNFRYIMLPSGSSDMVEVMTSGWVRGKLMKRNS
ncbi:MAG TPA: hypothetical protein PLW93_05490 [Candidatus Absconditabacterales bacterium]|nr:hypothetical protein [Candidatus Absconditabacterales bacterium]HNG97698.1 hypothetical protein [Candidatus Absconditabacterales bacterium]